MPNSLAHFGVGRLLTRCVIQDVHPLWIYTGCIVPDVPWILQRAAAKLPLDLDPYEVRLYAMSQASLTGCLLLSLALAALASAPSRVFGVLAVNSLVHLLLDACETKWANGVHLFAPVSWQIYNAELFWPESVAVLGLTAFGLAVFIADWIRSGDRPAQVSLASRSKPLAAACWLCLLAYFLLPYYVQEDLRYTDGHFVSVLRDAENRSGRYIEMDRNRFIADGRGGVIQTFAGEDIRVIGTLPDRSGQLSIRGTFVDSTTIRVQAFHEHMRGIRDWASILGLLLLGLWWLQRLYLALSRKSRPTRLRLSPDASN
jgi:hypothetical protein